MRQTDLLPLRVPLRRVLLLTVPPLALAALLGIWACGPPSVGDDASKAMGGTATSPHRLRVATFNVKELGAEKLGAEKLGAEKLATVDERGAGSHPQLLAAAAVLRRVRPDILVLQEVDHQVAPPESSSREDLGAYVRLFESAYLQGGDDGLSYPYLYAAPNNTGRLTGLDLDGNGLAAGEGERGSRQHGDDSYGFGTYPGQYSMAVLSRYPLLGEEARTFQRFLWKDLPGNHLPRDFYPPEVVEIFRLSSKSHWDLPVDIGGKRLHLLVSHPTPPVFDGDEDRNGRRNFDEIKLWAEYLDGSDALVDDAGHRGGLGDGTFVLMGDLNAKPGSDMARYDGRDAIEQLLAHPRIQDTGAWAVSRGAVEAGLAATSTATFSGGARVDYVLPSRDLEVLGGGVFWPAAADDPEGHRLAEEASDHRLVWMDLAWPPVGDGRH